MSPIFLRGVRKMWIYCSWCHLCSIFLLNGHHIISPSWSSHQLYNNWTYRNKEVSVSDFLCVVIWNARVWPFFQGWLYARRDSLGGHSWWSLSIHQDISQWAETTAARCSCIFIYLFLAQHDSGKQLNYMLSHSLKRPPYDNTGATPEPRRTLPPPFLCCQCKHFTWKLETLFRTTMTRITDPSDFELKNPMKSFLSLEADGPRKLSRAFMLGFVAFFPDLIVKQICGFLQ